MTAKDCPVAMRIFAEETTVEASQPISVIAELRNTTDSTVNVLRPFGDEYRARAAGIELSGPKGKLKYTGDTPSYSLGSGSFGNLATRKIDCDILKLSVSDFAGSDELGEYTITYTYVVTKDDRTTADGLWLRGIWVGELKSQPIRVTKR